MIEIPVLLVLLACHLVADFVFQSDWMATNKSKRTDALLIHTTIYAACFLWAGLPFAVLTWGCHTATDFVTSRTTSALWARGARHWFFVVIGIDQFLHQAQLILTWSWLGIQ